MSATTKILIGAGVAVGVYLVWKAWDSSGKAQNQAAINAAYQQVRTTGINTDATYALIGDQTSDYRGPTPTPAAGSMGAH